MRRRRFIALLGGAATARCTWRGHNCRPFQQPMLRRPLAALALLLHGGLARNHRELRRRPLERFPSLCATV
jgi:hypothetical protein